MSYSISHIVEAVLVPNFDGVFSIFTMNL